jgi:hypothetical protein
VQEAGLSASLQRPSSVRHGHGWRASNITRPLPLRVYTAPLSDILPSPPPSAGSCPKALAVHCNILPASKGTSSNSIDWSYNFPNQYSETSFMRVSQNDRSPFTQLQECKTTSRRDQELRWRLEAYGRRPTIVSRVASSASPRQATMRADFGMPSRVTLYGKSLTETSQRVLIR